MYMRVTGSPEQDIVLINGLCFPRKVSDSRRITCQDTHKYLWRSSQCDVHCGKANRKSKKLTAWVRLSPGMSAQSSYNRYCHSYTL